MQSAARVQVSSQYVLARARKRVMTKGEGAVKVRFVDRGDAQRQGRCPGTRVMIPHHVYEFQVRVARSPNADGVQRRFGVRLA